ncbi:MAG: dihydrodipicolinate synthase family protein [Clostridia bacterium]|nr:dihydrodipicolinate synthase family protein [Clostridia bacterium]
MIKEIPNGVYPTMITPYTSDNRIDYAAVEALLHWYAANGANGVFAICQSSEIFFLSFEERLSLLHFIMTHKPDGMTVVASGHTADDFDQQIEQAKAFIAEGIDAYVFIANRFARAQEGDDVFLRRYEAAVDALPEIALGVYECPYPYKRLMTPETLRACALGGRLQFLKDTCCRMDLIRAKLAAVADTPLKIFNANAALLLESLQAGCAGYSGVMANFHPELYAWLCGHFASDPETAAQVQAFLGFASVAECQCYPVNAKYHLNLCGVPMEIASRARDAAEFGESRRREIEQMYAVTQIVKNQVGI